MQIQFDPFSFGVAVVALLVAWRAHTLSKRAPLLDREREHRDRLRDSLLAVEQTLRLPVQLLGVGKDVPPAPDELTSAIATVRELSPRLSSTKERRLLAICRGALLDLRHAWRTTEQHEGAVGRLQALVDDWEDRVADAANQGARSFARETLNSYRRGLDESIRARDAARPDMAAKLKDTGPAIGNYVAYANSKDRGAKD